MNKKISIISLGCAKNLVDSESILALLGEKNFIITDSWEDSDIVIINTCAFIKEAVDESLGVIKEIVENKGERKIVVGGCLVQRFKEKVFEIEDIDGIVGTGDPEKFIEVVEELNEKEKIKKIDDKTFFTKKVYPRLITTFPYAYLKIAEGCDNRCNYCLIPYLRGKQRSKRIVNILEEAEDLLNLGIKDLVIIAQDTANYGKDLKDGTNLKKLLREIVKIGFKWIRIMYTYPAHLDDEVIEVVAENKNICKYLDIPLQHSHPEILEKMGRPIVDYYRIIEKIREKIKDVRLRTTFMVGFPGEKENHFNHLVNFLKEVEFDRCGFFKYSREEGTPAYNFPDQVCEEEKQQRFEKLIEVQRKISEKRLEKMVGNVYEVLVEGKEGKFYIGRTEYDAPEIDGIVYISGKNLKIGNFYKVKITSSTDYDLYGEKLVEGIEEPVG